MSIKIDSTLGKIRLNISSDPDHFADYDVSIWEKSGAKWIKIPGAITPVRGDTLAQPDHDINVLPAGLDGRLLYLEARVNAVTQQPLELELNINVWQDFSQEVVHRVNSTKPVPPGKTRNLTAEFIFSVA